MKYPLGNFIIAFFLLTYFTGYVFAQAPQYDFEARTVNTITTTVGKTFDLKIDVANKGTLKDSYNVNIVASSPGLANILPSIISTDTVAPNGITSVYSSVTPLANTNNLITVTVTSVACQSCAPKTLDIPLKTGLLNLPEYGLAGFLTIMITAGVIYFLITNKMIKN